ncbi:hypothetical protein EV121DRAFT_297763 [Schizophyllum commune]
MAWSSSGGGTHPAWQTTHQPFASHPIAVRQSPGDQQAYAYSWALYTNSGDYPMPVQPPIAPPRRHQEPEWLRESRREHEAWEARRSQRVIYPPQQLPPSRSHAAQTTIGAARLPVHPAIDTKEEAARQALSAAAPPPARPARSTARMQPPPIPPPATRPRIDTRYDDARVELHARDASPAATWREPPPAGPPLPPTRPPPRPARAAARRQSTPTLHDHPSDTPPCAMSARATSPGDADRTVPTNDRSSLPSTSTTTAPPTCPSHTATVLTRSHVLPPRPPRVYGPRAPSTEPDHPRQTDSNDVLQDTAYLRAIEGYAQEGGERENAKGGGGEDALVRSVRGTQLLASPSTNPQFSRDRVPLRAIGTSARPTTATAATAGHNECGRGGQVEAAFSASPLLHRDCDVSGEVRESRSTHRMATSSTREAATRTSDRDMTPAISPFPRSILKSPPPALCVPPWRPALRRHAMPATLPPPAPVDDRAPPALSMHSSARHPDSALAIEAVHCSGRERAAPVPALPRHIDAGREGQDSSTLRVAYANGSRMMISSVCGIAHATTIATPSSPFLATPSSQPDSPSAAHPRRRSPADARASPPRPVRAAARSSDAKTGQAEQAPECAISNIGSTCGGARPSGSLPNVRAVTHHPPASTPPCMGRYARMEDFALLATAESRQEYTGADGVRLAIAPTQERGEGLRRASCADSACPNTTATALPRPQRVISKPPPQPSFRPPPLRPMNSNHSPPLTVLPRGLIPSADNHIPLSRPARSYARQLRATTMTCAPHTDGMLGEHTSAENDRRGTATPVILPENRAADDHEQKGGKLGIARATLAANVSSIHARLAPCPPPPHLDPVPSRPARLEHPTPMVHPHSTPIELRTPPPQSTWSIARGVDMATRATRAEGRATVPSQGSACMRKEYTSSEDFRLARAPVVAFGPARPVAGVHEQEWGEGPQRVRADLLPATHASLDRHPPSCHPAPSAHATVMRGRATPEEARLLATKHPLPPLASPPPPMPFLPPQGSSSAPSPPPRDWPFPISVQELGWVLAAVVMARRMDQEDEQRRRDEEYEDDYPLDPIEVNSDNDLLTHEVSNSEHTEGSVYDGHEHASDADMIFSVESPLQSPRNESPSSFAFDFDMAITRDGSEDEDEYTGNFDDLGWGEPSAPSDESGEDFVD